MNVIVMSTHQLYCCFTCFFIILFFQPLRCRKDNTISIQKRIFRIIVCTETLKSFSSHFILSHLISISVMHMTAKIIVEGMFTFTSCRGGTNTVITSKFQMHFDIVKDFGAILAKSLFTSFLIAIPLAQAAADHPAQIFRRMFPDCAITSKHGCTRPKTAAIIKCFV